MLIRVDEEMLKEKLHLFQHSNDGPAHVLAFLSNHQVPDEAGVEGHGVYDVTVRVQLSQDMTPGAFREMLQGLTFGAEGDLIDMWDVTSLDPS